MTRKKKRKRQRHAAVRLVQRGAGGLSMDEIRLAVEKGVVEYLDRQTCSRSMIRIAGPDGWANAVINRKARSVITMLTEEQAAERLRAAGKELA
jgi:hypothetical protein